MRKFKSLAFEQIKNISIAAPMTEIYSQTLLLVSYNCKLQTVRTGVFTSYTYVKKSLKCKMHFLGGIDRYLLIISVFMMIMMQNHVDLTRMFVINSFSLCVCIISGETGWVRSVIYGIRQNNTSENFRRGLEVENEILIFREHITNENC